MFLLFYLLFGIVLNAEFNLVHADSSPIDLCNHDTSTNEITCDANYGNQTESDYFTAFSSLPSVEKYIFRNFKQIQTDAFENMNFLSNCAITMKFINVAIINSDAFSMSMNIPDSSNMSIDIEYSTNPSSLTLQTNAFNGIKINRLRFFNINYFNGQPIFDTDCFGEQLSVNELIFEQSDLTGFINKMKTPANVKQLSILQCPKFIQLTKDSLPTFLSTTESLEISNTGLKFINPHTFQEQSLVLKRLMIRNNMDFTELSPNMVNGTLTTLDTLDLSNNSITIIDPNYDWQAYKSVQHLILKQQQIDLFLKTNMLKTLENLRTIDFAEGLISDINDTFLYNNLPDMPHLVSMNISYTNFTDEMVISLLRHLTSSINQTMKISLLGYNLHDNNFCSYFTIFNRSSSFLQLELDEKHECNCIIDSFYKDEQIQMTMDGESLQKPSCLLNTTRTRCDIESHVSSLKCSLDKPNPDGSGTNNNKNGGTGFISYVVGFGVAAFVVLVVGSAMVYRRRKRRRSMTLIMEEPIENPLSTVIEQRRQHTK